MVGHRRDCAAAFFRVIGAPLSSLSNIVYQASVSTPIIFTLLYRPLFRPHLEYAVQALRPHLAKAIESTERNKRVIPIIATGLKHIPCED